MMEAIIAVLGLAFLVGCCVFGVARYLVITARRLVVRLRRP